MYTAASEAPSFTALLVTLTGRSCQKSPDNAHFAGPGDCVHKCKERKTRNRGDFTTSENLLSSATLPRRCLPHNVSADGHSNNCTQRCTRRVNATFYWSLFPVFKAKVQGISAHAAQSNFSGLKRVRLVGFWGHGNTVRSAGRSACSLGSYT